MIPPQRPTGGVRSSTDMSENNANIQGNNGDKNNANNQGNNGEENNDKHSNKIE